MIKKQVIFHHNHGHHKGSLFWLQSEGRINSSCWCISGGKHSHLLRKELCRARKTHHFCSIASIATTLVAHLVVTQFSNFITTLAPTNTATVAYTFITICKIEQVDNMVSTTKDGWAMEQYKQFIEDTAKQEGALSTNRLGLAKSMGSTRL